MTKPIDLDRRKVHSRPEPKTKPPTERVKSDAIVQQGEGVSIVEHLAKYLGKKVCVDTGSGPSYTGVLNEVFYRDLEIQVIADDETEHRFFGAEISSYIYPILKTTEDMNHVLINEYIEIIHGGQIDLCAEDDFSEMSLTSAEFTFLFDNSIGAIPDKDSPTGYISLHDLPKKLPCKRWSEVFDE